MRPKLTVIRLIAGDSGLLHLIEAATRFLPASVDVSRAPDLAGVPSRERPDETELLILANPAPAVLRTALQTVDSMGLPRWPVVVFGPVPGDFSWVESISTEEHQPRLVARAIQSAISYHRLRRDNSRLEGDLQTISFRVSHDFRGPLGGILMATDVLKETLAEDAPSCAELLEPIAQSATGAARLVSRISFLLRATSEHPSSEKLKMGEVFLAALDRIESITTGSRSKILQPDSWPVAAGNFACLEEVWCNLLENAIQHGRATRIEAGWLEKDGTQEYWVRDNGQGVAAGRRLFQPFHLLHLSASGRGFGLSIVQRLVELQGGHCRYEATPEGGSVFYFSLPSVEPARSRHRALPTSARNGH